MIPDVCRRSGDVCALTRPPTILETSIRTAGQVFFLFICFFFVFSSREFKHKPSNLCGSLQIITQIITI